MTLHNYPEYQDDVVISAGEHMKPCDQTGRDPWCFNEGKCFLVGQEEAKGCMCRTGYDGARCESAQVLIGASKFATESDMMVIHLLSIILFLLIVNSIALGLYIYCTIKVRRRNQHNEQKNIPAGYLDDSHVTNANTGYDQAWSSS